MSGAEALLVLRAGAAALYATTAVGLAFVNKSVLSVYNFKEANVMLLLQMLAAALGVTAMRAYGLVGDLAPLSLMRARSLTPVALLYCTNTALALASLDGLSVPVYTMLKRLTPAFVLLASAFSGRPPPPTVVMSTLLTVAGCVVAGIGDLAFDARAYALAVASCITQTAYLLTVERAKQGLSSHELLLYNSLLSVPFLLLMCILDGELASAPTSLARLARTGGLPGLVTLAGAVFQGVLLNFSNFLCTRVNSALTTTIVGILKGVMTTALGFLFLGGVRDATWLLLAGLALNTLGGSWYGWLEFAAKKGPGSRQQLPPDTDKGGHSSSPRRTSLQKDDNGVVLTPRLSVVTRSRQEEAA